MSTAVLISGQTRNFKDCLPGLHWHVFRKLSDPTFFVSVADDAQAADAYLLEGYYKNVFIERVKQPEMLEPNARHAAHAPYALASSIQGVLRQLWHLERVWKFMDETVRKQDWERKIPTNGYGFDCFVRCRPDLRFRDFVKPSEIRGNTAYSPNFGAFGGMNDRFAVMGPAAAAHYFSAFSKIDELLKLGCPLHPESLVKAAVEESGCHVDQTMIATFTTLNKNGSVREPELSISDILRL